MGSQIEENGPGKKFREKSTKKTGKSSEKRKALKNKRIFEKRTSKNALKKGVFPGIKETDLRKK